MAKEAPLHIVAYSLAGLDLRYALSRSPELQAITKSLITVGTPHKGSFLAQQFRRRMIDREHIDPICRVLGIQNRYFEEANPENMQDFNLVAANSSKVNVRQAVI